MQAVRGPPPVIGSMASHGALDLDGKSREKCWKSRTGASNTGKVNNLSHLSEGFPLTGYFAPACVGIWAWTGQKNCRRVAAVVVAAVGVTFLNARFSKQKLQKIMFLWGIQGAALI